MKAKKVFGIIFIVVGLILMAFGGLFAGKMYYDANTVTIVKDDIVTVENAVDDEFEIEVESPVLIREVKMVQWINDEKGPRMVLANYPIESFSIGSDNYTNPSFTSDYTSKVFIGSAKIANLNLDSKALELIGYEKIEDVNKTQYSELDVVKGLINNYVIRDGSYVTASDDWALGDVEISFYYLSEDDLKDFTVAGNIDGNSLKLKDKAIYKGSIADSIVKLDICEGIENYLYIAGAGVVVLIIGIILKATSKKKKEDKVFPPKEA